MTIKRISVLVLRIIALTIIGFVTMAIASAVTPQPDFLKAASTSSNSQTIVMLFVVRFILALIFVFILETTHLCGFNLMVMLFWLVFGVTTFVMQLETIIFGSAFPMLTAKDVILMAFTALVGDLLFIPSAVLVMGRMKGIRTPIPQLFQTRYFVRIGLLAIIYPALYFFFGFVIAWQSSAVREFYATTSITQSQLVLGLIQIGRGVLWVLAGLPLFVLFEKRIHSILASVLSYSLFPSIALLLPSSLMPEAVRMAHLLEISLSMAIFGLLVGLLMTMKKPLQVLKPIKQTA
jgi:hypothetical protein